MSPLISPPQTGLFKLHDFIKFLRYGDFNYVLEKALILINVYTIGISLKQNLVFSSLIRTSAKKKTTTTGEMFTHLNCHDFKQLYWDNIHMP